MLDGDAGKIRLVAFILGNSLGRLTERLLVGVGRHILMAANYFFSRLNPNHPVVFGFIERHFNTVRAHKSLLAQYTPQAFKSPFGHAKKTRSSRSTAEGKNPLGRSGTHPS